MSSPSNFTYKLARVQERLGELISSNRTATTVFDRSSPGELRADLSLYSQFSSTIIPSSLSLLPPPPHPDPACIEVIVSRPIVHPIGSIREWKIKISRVAIEVIFGYINRYNLFV